MKRILTQTSALAQIEDFTLNPEELFTEAGLLSGIAPGFDFTLSSQNFIPLDSPFPIAELDGTDGIDIITVSGTVDNVFAFGGNDAVTITSTGVVEGVIGGGAGDDTITNSGLVELQIIGDSGNDTIINEGTVAGPNNGAGNIFGSDGNDIITNTATGSASSLLGGVGNDTITNEGTLTGSIFSEEGSDTITNSGTLTGSIIAGDDNDSVFLLDGSSVGGSIDGGAGTDALSFLGRTSGVTFAVGDFNTVNFENIRGTDFGDILSNGAGSTLNGSISGNDGDDSITNFGTVNFSLTGGEGNDAIFNSGTVSNAIFAGDGNDVITNSGTVTNGIFGDDGNDTVILLEGSIASTVNGDGGFDTLSFAGRSEGISFTIGDLNTVNFEAYVGTDFDDALTGGVDADTLTGGFGNDTLNGGDADDILYGDVGDVEETSGVGLGSGSFARAAEAGNSDIASAIDITNSFSFAADPNIVEAERDAHVTITGTGDATPTVHYYQVTINTAGAIITLDTDASGLVDFDTEITLFDAAGNALANDDDSSTSEGAGGSTSGLDSFLTFTVTEAGTYFIAMGAFIAGAVGEPSPVPEGDSYQLHVSITEPEINADLLGTSNDILNGGAGNDTLHGHFGDDILDGGEGDDTLNGGTGNDTLIASAGFDGLNGGDGDDFIVFDTANGSEFLGNFRGDGGVNAIVFQGDGFIDLDNAGTDFFDIQNLIFAVDGNTGTRTVQIAGFEIDGANEVSSTAAVEGRGVGLVDELIVNDGEPNAVTDLSGWTFSNWTSGEDIVQIIGRDSNFYTIIGSRVDDIILGLSGNDTLSGGQGNDTISGGDGADTLNGNVGDDVLDGGAGNDLLIGAAGNDTLTGGADQDQLFGGAGNDELDGGTGNDSLFGDVGIDMLTGGDGLDILRGGDDDDMLFGGNDRDRLFGDAGDDFLAGDAGDDDLLGGDGADTLFGNSGTDRLFGEAGEDIINGGTGDDLIRGGDGADTLNGDAGADRLFGDAQADEINGGAGDDLLRGGEGSDTLRGGTENDRLFGEAGNDVLGGDAGNDDLFGGVGDDIMLGANGDDRLFGEAGNDVLSGGNGVDLLRGGDDNDTLTGGAGDDRLFGDSGDDSLAGGEGTDVLTGGAGDDSFAYELGSGVDAITDFGFGTDTILVDDAFGLSGFADLQILQRGANTLIRLEPGGADTLILFNTTAADLTAADFVFEGSGTTSTALVTDLETDFASMTEEAVDQAPAIDLNLFDVSTSESLLEAFSDEYDVFV